MAYGAKVARLGVLTALALGVHLVEAQIPVPVPVPGAKLGLANVVTLVVLALDGPASGITVSVVRAVLGGLLRGVFLGPGFMMSLAGAVMSSIAMALALTWLARWLSPIGVSLIGSAVHNVSQVATYYLLTGQAGIFSYLPVLLVVSIPTGLFVGIMGGLLIKRATLAGAAARTGALETSGGARGAMRN